MQDTDEDLMAAVANGKLFKLGKLYERYQTPLYRYAFSIHGSRERAEDSVQETFRKVLQYRESYRSDLVFRHWLFRIGRNVCLDAQQFLGVAEASNQHPETDGPESLQIQSEQIKALRAAMFKLSESQRELITLARFQEFSGRDIAAITGLSEANVRVQLHRAMQKLKTLLTTAEDHPNG